MMQPILETQVAMPGERKRREVR